MTAILIVNETGRRLGRNYHFLVLGNTLRRRPPEPLRRRPRHPVVYPLGEHQVQVRVVRHARLLRGAGVQRQRVRQLARRHVLGEAARQREPPREVQRVGQRGGQRPEQPAVAPLAPAGRRRVQPRVRRRERRHRARLEVHHLAQGVVPLRPKASRRTTVSHSETDKCALRVFWLSQPSLWSPGISRLLRHADPLRGRLDSGHVPEPRRRQDARFGSERCSTASTRGCRPMNDDDSCRRRDRGRRPSRGGRCS